MIEDDAARDLLQAWEDFKEMARRAEEAYGLHTSLQLQYDKGQGYVSMAAAELGMARPIIQKTWRQEEG